MIDTAMDQEITRLERCYSLEDLNQRALGKVHNPKKNVTNVEAAEFWKNMQSKEYTVEEQLKILAHIYIWSLLVNFKAHRNALMELLSGVNIPKETTSEVLDAMIGRIVEDNKILFHDYELPIEGLAQQSTSHHSQML